VNPHDSSPTIELVQKLKTQMPEIRSQAEVVGRWVWLEFNIPPAPEVRGKLKELSFHWNHKRPCWHPPCGAPSAPSRHDPRAKYPVTPATALELNETMAPVLYYRDAA
jgi:hypothetical protein